MRIRKFGSEKFWVAVIAIISMAIPQFYNANDIYDMSEVKNTVLGAGGVMGLVTIIWKFFGGNEK